jgi:hypothetical protein
MKTQVIFYACMLLAISAIAQKECKDIIYSQEGEKILFDCCIIEVRNSNNVIYAKGGDTLNILAHAITKDGEYIELVKSQNKAGYPNIQNESEQGLYRGHDFKYYEKLFYGSRTRQGFGVFFTVLGFGLEIGGIVIASDEYASDDDLARAGNLILIGSLCETIGIPLWISGGVRKANNRKAMEEIQRNNGLSLGVSNYGIGVVYRF